MTEISTVLHQIATTIATIEEEVVVVEEEIGIEITISEVEVLALALLILLLIEIIVAITILLLLEDLLLILRLSVRGETMGMMVEEVVPVVVVTAPGIEGLAMITLVDMTVKWEAGQVTVMTGRMVGFVPVAILVDHLIGRPDVVVMVTHQMLGMLKEKG